MEMHKYFFRVIALAACTLPVFFSACKDKTDEKEIPRNIVTIHYLSEPTTLHPTNGTDGSRLFAQEYMQRTLTRIDMRTYKQIPLLVTKLPEAAANNLDYTYELRSDVRWDDGKPLTPADVIFTMKVIKCPLTANM